MYLKWRFLLNLNMRFILILVSLLNNSFAKAQVEDTIPFFEVIISVYDLDYSRSNCDSIEVEIFEDNLKINSFNFKIRSEIEVKNFVNNNVTLGHNYVINFNNNCSKNQIDHLEFSTKNIVTPTRLIREVYFQLLFDKQIVFPQLYFEDEFYFLTDSQKYDLQKVVNIMNENLNFVVQIIFTYHADSLPEYILARNKEIQTYITERINNSNRLLIKNLKVDEVNKKEMLLFEIIAFDYSYHD